MHLQDNTILTFKVTQNLAQYPLHHLTYSATKLEVATSNSLGVDTFTRNLMDRLTDGQTYQLWYEINIHFFLKKKAGVTNLKEDHLGNICAISFSNHPVGFPSRLLYIGKTDPAPGDHVFQSINIT